VITDTGNNIEACFDLDSLDKFNPDFNKRDVYNIDI
jgi:hypothetical protein